MIGHKCNGCRYEGEHVEMGFKPFGVCYKETNLIKAQENYNAETCPYKYSLPQLYKTDPEPLPEPEPWPKENPYLTMAQAVQKAADALVALSKQLVEALRPTVEKLVETLVPIVKTIGDRLEEYPDKRVIYLAKHGKERTKKKNVKRILKWFNEQGREPSKKRSSRGYIDYTERDGRIYAVYRTE